MLEYEHQLEESFQPSIDAAKNIVIKTLYAILVLIAAMIVVNILGWIICRCLRVQRQAIIDRIVPPVPVDSSVQTFINQDQRGSDLDSDEADGEMDTRAPKTPNPPLSGQASFYVDSPRTLATQPEFKFSETNV